MIESIPFPLLSLICKNLRDDPISLYNVRRTSHAWNKAGKKCFPNLPVHIIAQSVLCNPSCMRRLQGTSLTSNIQVLTNLLRANHQSSNLTFRYIPRAIQTNSDFAHAVIVLFIETFGSKELGLAALRFYHSQSPLISLIDHPQIQKNASLIEAILQDPLLFLAAPQEVKNCTPLVEAIFKKMKREKQSRIDHKYFDLHQSPPRQKICSTPSEKYCDKFQILDPLPEEPSTCSTKSCARLPAYSIQLCKYVAKNQLQERCNDSYCYDFFQTTGLSTTILASSLLAQAGPLPQDDDQVVLLALQIDIKSFKSASPRLKNDLLFIRRAIKYLPEGRKELLAYAQPQVQQILSCEQVDNPTENMHDHVKLLPTTGPALVVSAMQPTHYFLEKEKDSLSTMQLPSQHARSTQAFTTDTYQEEPRTRPPSSISCCSRIASLFKCFCI